MSPLRPPALARLLLRLVLPRGLREPFMGDLEERFRRTAARDPRRARRDYWLDALSPSLLRLRREARGMTLPPGSPPGSASGDPMMNRLLQDFRFAFRMIRKAPAFTAVAVGSLALGIGPNTAIFSLADSLLFQDWGVEEPATVMDIYTLTEEGEYFASYHSLLERIREEADDAFAGVAASTQFSGTMEGEGGTELVMGEMVTGNYFQVAGVGAEPGRTFLPEEDATPGTHPVVVLSHRYWMSRYDADPGMVGAEVRLNGRPYTVVGIAPPAFRGRVAPGIGTDFWVPLSMYTHLSPQQMGYGNLLITARLASGVGPDQARARLDAVAARVNEARAESRSELRIGAVVLDDVLLHPGIDNFLVALTALLFVAVGLVLLVACVNLAGFLLSRATERRREMAVRVAMGAGRSDLLRQLLAESLVLATLGGLLGLGLGLAALRLLTGIDLPINLPVALEAGLNGRVLAFTGGATLLAALLFGLAPALEATRAPVASTLRGETAGGGGRKSNRMRKVLVAGQMALSTVLLVGAALFMKSLGNATAMEVGFDTGPATVVTVEAWAADLTDQEERDFARALLDHARATPGVREAGLVSRLPLELGVTNSGFAIPGVEPPPNADLHVLELAHASPGYLEVMGIPVLEGRGITAMDRAGEEQVAVVSRALAERFWPGESALGRVLHRRGDPDDALVVVGVAGDARIWSLTEEPRPYLYLPAAQGNAYGRYHLVARGAVDPLVVAREVREAARSRNPDVFFSRVGTMDDHLAWIYFLPRMGAFLLLLVGGLAACMACVGLYGMVSYAVARRTREMGIRLALGAERGRVVGLVVRGGLALAMTGGAAGLLLAALAGSSVERFLIGVDGVDPLALVAAPTFLLAVAALAAWLPARRAAGVDPARALRSE